MNVAEVLSSAVERHASRPAVTDAGSGRALTYGQLAGEAERMAGFLRQRGVQRGQRVGLLAPNALAYLPAAFGLLATGACLVPLAPGLTATELDTILRTIDVNGCLCWPGAGLLTGPETGTTLSGGECDGFRFGWIDRDAEAPAGFADLNPAFVRFTSGTTAESKGVVLSHEATAARVAAASRALGLTCEDRILWVLPLAYHFAVTIVAYVRAGAHVLMCSGGLPGALVKAVRQLRATILYASPLHFQRMGCIEPGGPLPTLRLALSTSAPITRAVMARFEATYGVPVGQAYGIIEAGLPCINLGGDDAPATSVGRPIPGYDVQVFPDDGLPVQGGPMGEIGLRGDGLFSAYYAPWRLREEVTRDGWFLTGDIGWMDATGALYLRGRTNAVISFAGLKFFPEEVEECINQFPGVKESRVFGRPHPHLGQVPSAEVVLDSPPVDVEAIKAHCARMLSPYKVPLDVTVVPGIPRTPGGKIQRRPSFDVEAR